jgi:predicted Ser/Thr protein kinase
MDVVGDLKKYVETHKETNEELPFEQYLAKVRTSPGIACNAHKRIYDMIRSYGVVVDTETNEERYKFFESQLFGVETSTRQVMEYFKGAALGSDVGRRFLLLYGPPSSGKSNLVSMLKDAMEDWSKTDAGAVYAIKGCPMNEEPLHLIPALMRADVAKDLKVSIEGELCPVCAWRLKNEFKGDFSRFQVRRVYFSQQNRIGVGTFVPSDPKCVVGSTLLLSDQGMVTFDELQEKIGAEDDEFKPLEITVSGVKGQEKTQAFYNGAQKETYRITTKLGYEIEGSAKHPIQCLENGVKVWKKLEYVTTGDYIVLQKGQMIFGKNMSLPQPQKKPHFNSNEEVKIPKRMSLAFARFLGYMVSEGCTSEDAIWFTNFNAKIMQDFCTCAKEAFGVEPKLYHNKTMAAISCRHLRRWLEDSCGMLRGSANKEMPAVIRTAPREYVLEFIETLSWGDSTVSSRGELSTNRYKYTSVSKRLCRQLQVMFLNLGIPASFYEGKVEYEGEQVDAYTTQVTGDDVWKLLSLLGELREKNTNSCLAPITGKTNFDLVPGISEIVAMILAKVKEEFRNQKKKGYSAQFCKYNRYSYPDSHPDHRKFTRESLNGFIEDVVPYAPSMVEQLKAILKEEDLLYLPVKTVGRTGVNQVYDLTVPETHSFCANGIICHNSQDIAELIGSVDLSKIGEYGTESDPRAYRFDGELNIANRGLMEFIEILKVDIKFLYVLLTATQEKNIKTPRFPLISCDEVILTHTNETEYKKFVSQAENEALIDRMIVCRLKYNLKVDSEIEIYKKLLAHGDTGEIHIAPHTLKVASMFAILSRLEDPKDQSVNKVKKMKLYNGEDVEGLTKQDIPRLQKEAVMEGMDGISPRYIINRLVTTSIKKADVAGGKRYITPVDVLKALREGLETTSKFGPEEKARYEELFGLVKAEFDYLAQTEVQKAFFVSFEAEAQTLLNNYIDNVEAYLDETKLKDPLTDQDIDPDEKLMRSIETKIGVSDEGKDSFRNEVMRKVAAALRRNQKFRYEDHTRLREAVEKQMFEERRDVIKMTITSRTKDPDELKRINQVVGTLCDKHGYIPESANELLKYVSSMMSREK